MRYSDSRISYKIEDCSLQKTRVFKTASGCLIFSFPDIRTWGKYSLLSLLHSYISPEFRVTSTLKGIHICMSAGARAPGVRAYAFGIPGRFSVLRSTAKNDGDYFPVYRIEPEYQWELLLSSRGAKPRGDLPGESDKNR